ncbi:tRNA pseudouridine(38/39) synthase isoform X1 [Nilaparvata lugens]|uniref:tRNA pseudouridine(38/39) synthase isoform X1 n=2 Tax=Nilaparvata lugens TaxID=108931 RepID=UPI00193DF7DB|nr:tRNA pseudouridine(38/39) synthase isoform X1 [Nilaparvata lugens]
MTDSAINVTVKKKRKFTNDKNELLKMDKEELVDLLIRMESHNEHLKNIIAKLDSPTEECDTRKKRQFDFSKCRKHHVLFHVMYLGWDYQGFACQDFSSKTIEHNLMSALMKACLIESPKTANYHKCGRTDKGVSSFGQVISLDVRCADEEQNDIPYCKMLNNILPDDIKVLAWAPVPQHFSARFDCKSRTYRYSFPKGNMDIEAMNKALPDLIGSHDFRNLCKMDIGNGVVKFVRTILDVKLTKLFSDPFNKSSGYDMYTLTISSEGFLWHQIRCIMAVLILIGEGKESPSIIKELLDTEKHPRKPQYCLALELPLDLHDSDFGHIDWRYDEISLQEAVKNLQKCWTTHEIKATIIRDSIEEIMRLLNGRNIDAQASGLLPSPNAKVYKPLLERPTCGELITL